MFKIFTFRQIAIISFFLCLIMLLGSLLNSLSPYAEVFSSKIGVEIPIIMYHQISENKSIWGDYVIPLSVLEEDFIYMKHNNINPISFEHLQLFAEKGTKLPENPIIITFDDGEKSFLTKVLPLLEEFNFPANINVVGSLVELYTQNGDTDDRYAYLNENDIKNLVKNELVTIGCHSYNLHSLSGRRGMGKLYGESEEEYKNLINNDIDKFNSVFEKITGAKTNIIAYPYGIKNEALKNIVRKNGFDITLTCREGTNKISVGSSLEELGRFNRPYGKSSKSFFEKIYKE